MTAILELQGVTKAYQMGGDRIVALKSVDLTLTSGAFTALQGPSGSGKSTLLNLCGLLDRADNGSCRLDGVDVFSQSDRRLTDLRRSMIGFVFQGFNLVPVMTVFENVEYPLLLTGASVRERRLAVDAMLDRVGLAEHRRHRPDQLSGGQRQRAAVARALVKRPRLVIADEPTANLDSSTASQIIDLMHEISQDPNGDIGVFLIATHDQRMAERCDRILTLKDGVIQ